MSVLNGASEQKLSPSWVTRLFYGRDGLRAGWSMLLFVLTLALLGRLSSPLLQHLLSHRPKHGAAIPAIFTLAAESFSFLLAALSAFAVSLVERRSFGCYGLGVRPGWVRQLAGGLCLGALLLSAMVWVLRATGLLLFTGRQLTGVEAWKWGTVTAAAFFAVALFEEFLTRGFLQFTLARAVAGMAGAAGMSERSRRVLGFWAAALLFSILFSLGHKNNLGESPIGLLSAGLIGLVFALSLWRTGTLWWAIGFHAAWDWMQSFVYGVADSGTMMEHHLLVSHPLGSPLMSGGLTGPEGSIYVLGAVVLATGAIAVFLPAQVGSPAHDAEAE